MNWFRLHHGTVYDAKWLEIADELRESGRVGLFRRGWRAVARLIGGASCNRATPPPWMIAHIWTALLEHASEQAERGSVARFSARRHAAFCQVDRRQVEEVLAAFERHGMIVRDADGVRLAKWDERQRDLSTTRVQKHRAQQLEIANPDRPVRRRVHAASTEVTRQDVGIAGGESSPTHGARRITYVELAAVRGISVGSARRLVLRHGWSRQTGNDGIVTVTVPLTPIEHPSPNPLEALRETDETVMKRCETVGNARESESEVDLKSKRLDQKTGDGSGADAPAGDALDAVQRSRLAKERWQLAEALRTMPADQVEALVVAVGEPAPPHWARQELDRLDRQVTGRRRSAAPGAGQELERLNRQVTGRRRSAAPKAALRTMPADQAGALVVAVGEPAPPRWARNALDHLDQQVTGRRRSAAPWRAPTARAPPPKAADETGAGAPAGNSLEGRWRRAPPIEPRRRGIPQDLPFGKMAA